MKSNRAALYCTADDKYIRWAIVALKSVLRYENFDPYVLSGDLSDHNIALLKRYSIGYVNTDKHAPFSDYKVGGISYLMLAGPEIFYEWGYYYSMGIDADILCVKPLNSRSIFDRTKFYAGVLNQGPRKDNFHNRSYIQKKYKLSDEDMITSNINTGVIFWNNKAVYDYGLFAKCVDAWEADAFSAMDQGLFSLVSIGLPLNELPMGYNFRLGNKIDRREGCDDIKIYHFTTKKLKPWRRINELTREWRQFARSLNLIK